MQKPGATPQVERRERFVALKARNRSAFALIHQLDYSFHFAPPELNGFVTSILGRWPRLLHFSPLGLWDFGHPNEADVSTI
jgi:hypothetical protein